MGRLFGTDGVRGLANRFPMTSEMALKIGRAVAIHFKAEGKSGIVIGKDTRLSGDMLESALVSGICSVGVDVYLAGVIPTPAVAYLAKSLSAMAGIVISASHNPYEDNGIKVFKGDGFKLNDRMEGQIEGLIGDDATIINGLSPDAIGRIHHLEDAGDRYVAFLRDTFSPEKPLGGQKIVIDCSNGATCLVAPLLFSAIGASYEALFISPDGRNINDNCGSQYTASLSEKVLEAGAAIGLAFDGDGDRLIAVDEKGESVTGDQILTICARHALERGELANNRVVSTVMSNVGMRSAMKSMGIEHLISDVGDRYVVEEMLKSGAVIGGEDSGHMIFMDGHTTGDGMLSALKLLEALAHADIPLSELKGVMEVFPQVLINVAVEEKVDTATVPEIMAAIEAVESELAEEGRVLVRYSGTQPLLRVMVEGPTPEVTRECCERITESVQKTIGVKAG